MSCRNLICFFITLLYVVLPFRVHSLNVKNEMENTRLDYIMQRVFEFAPFYSRIIDKYEADLYLKARLKLHKSNKLMEVVPSMFRFENGVDEYIVESISELRYTAPDIYDRKTTALISTLPQNADFITDFMEFLNINAYAPTLMEDKILMPIDKECAKYYTFSVDSIVDIDGFKQYKISASPKFNSTQLVSGFFWVREETWTIRELYINGKFDLFAFKIFFEMGEDGDYEFLPCKVNLNVNFKFLKNHWEMDAYSLLNYKSISYNYKGNIGDEPKNKSFDLTDKYLLSSDSSRVASSIELFDSIRPLSLNLSEDSLYRAFHLRKETVCVDSLTQRKQKKREFWGQIGDAMLYNYRVKLPEIGSVRCSPIINPLTLNYTHNGGLTYRQKFKYNRLFSNGKYVRVIPQIGYNFTYNYWQAKLNAYFIYWPQRNGGIELNVGNDNRVHRSIKVESILLEMRDELGLMNLKRLNSYNDIYLKFYHQLEILNGLNVKVGVKYHHKHYAKDIKRDFYKIFEVERLEENIKPNYKSFSPNVRIEWTPALYYYMNGNRKINIGSSYPTFIFDYEHGIKGILGGVDSHERIELDVLQIVKLGKLASVAYRIGGGIYTRRPESSFYSYADFSRGSIPDNFKDVIGGTFQVLPRELFYTYDNYWRSNVTYETPFIFLRPLNNRFGMIQHERIYGGVLIMPHYNPYIEVGYGIGTHVFDAGVFVGLNKGKFESVGFKFTFELFKD